jgi:hypothetical protein
MEEVEREASCCIVIGFPDKPEIKLPVYILAPSPSVDLLLKELDIKVAKDLATQLVSLHIPGEGYDIEFKDFTIEGIGLMIPSVDDYLEWLKQRNLGDHTPCSMLYFEPLAKIFQESYGLVAAGEIVFLRRRVFYHASEIWQPDNDFKQVLSPSNPSVCCLEEIWRPRIGVQRKLMGAFPSHDNLMSKLASLGNRLLDFPDENTKRKKGRPSNYNRLSLRLHLNKALAKLCENEIRSNSDISPEKLSKSLPRKVLSIDLYRTEDTSHLRRDVNRFFDISLDTYIDDFIHRNIDSIRVRVVSR